MEDQPMIFFIPTGYFVAVENFYFMPCSLKCSAEVEDAEDAETVVG